MRFLRDADREDIEAGNYAREGTTCILVNNKAQVLLQLRDEIPTIRYPGHWTMPGGVMEPGETPEQTIRRELWEELGWRVGDLDLYGRIIDAYRNLIHIFSARLDLPADRLVRGEGRELRFFGAHELDGLKVTPHALEVLRHFYGQGG